MSRQNTPAPLILTPDEVADLVANHPRPGVRLLAAEVQRLRAFATKVLQQGCWDTGGGLDGGDLQRMAQELHVVRRVQLPSSCGEGCACDELCPSDHPRICYRLSWSRVLPGEFRTDATTPAGG